jgi:4-diphosphocytidyl-2-C-methyl-D-erythritol kinase
LHYISSWMVTVDLVDDLHVTRLDEGSISRYAIEWHDDAKQTTELDWRIQDDLTVKAHQAMERYTGRQLPVQLRLRKRTPVGGGLGGGSSDAAAMLRACNQLFDLDLDAAALCHVAASVGSDVPFLVQGGSAIVGGFGEHVEPCDLLPAFHAVLILPAYGCPTGAVYGRYDASGAGVLDESGVRAVVEGNTPFNDLAEPALDEAPELRALSSAIEATIARDLHVSGSGSTLFVICDTDLEATAIASAIEAQHGVPAIAVSPIALKTS